MTVSHAVRRIPAIPAVLALLPAILLVVASCATMGTPPGGPEDTAPPAIVRTVPDSGAVNHPDRALVVHFDEVVSDRPAGVTDLAGLVLISPRTGAPRVDWRRTSIAIRPRGGWLRDVTYTVTLLPGLGDVQGNAIKSPSSIVFATGPVLATASVSGRLFDWVAERPVIGGIVEAVSLPVGRDSVIYVGASDSSGAFTVGPLPAGSYMVRGFADQNRNRARDRVELWDSLAVTASAAGAPIELLAALRDTVGPRISTIVQRDSLTLELTVDRPMRPNSVAMDRVRIVRGDSTPVAVASVELRSARDVATRRDAAAAIDDTSAAAGRDTTARDSTARDTTARPPAGALRDTTADTTAAAARPSRPAPPTVVVIRLAAPLAAGTSYRISIQRLVSITGATRSSERVHSTPKPPSPSPRAPGDTLPTPSRPVAAPSPAPVRPDTTRPSTGAPR